MTYPKECARDILKRKSKANALKYVEGIINLAVSKHQFKYWRKVKSYIDNAED